MNTMAKVTGCAACAFMLSGASLLAQDLNNEVLSCGVSLLDVPYVAGVLDEDGSEELILNTDELDQTTFVEYVVAMARTPKNETNEKDEEVFADYVKKLRYRDGVIDGYTSRLHYATEWVSNAIRAGILQDITARQSQYTTVARAGHMSSHKEAYRQLANSPENVRKMQEIEQRINGTEQSYIPKAYLPNEGFKWIKDGDIIVFTTDKTEPQAAHMGIAFNINGKLTLMHASAKAKKVEVSKLTILKMLEENPDWTGIRVLRVVR